MKQACVGNVDNDLYAMKVAPQPSKVCAAYALPTDAHQAPPSLRRRCGGHKSQDLEKQLAFRSSRRSRVKQTKDRVLSGSLSARRPCSPSVADESVRPATARVRSTSLPLTTSSSAVESTIHILRKKKELEAELVRVQEICANCKDKSDTFVDSNVMSGFMQRYDCKRFLSMLESELGYSEPENCVAGTADLLSFDEDQQATAAHLLTPHQQQVSVAIAAATARPSTSSAKPSTAKTENTNRRKQVKQELKRLNGSPLITCVFLNLIYYFIWQRCTVKNS